MSATLALAVEQIRIRTYWMAGLQWRLEALDDMLSAQYELVEAFGPALGMLS